MRTSEIVGMVGILGLGSATACSSLIGLDEFSPQTSIGGTAGAGGTTAQAGGTAGNDGTAGSTTGGTGGTAGVGGYVVPAPEDCIRAVLKDEFTTEDANGLIRYRIPFSTSLGEVGSADELAIKLRRTDEGDIDFTPELLKDGDKNCFECAQANIDFDSTGGGKLFSAVAGRFSLGWFQEDKFHAEIAFSVSGFILAEATVQNGVQTLTPGGTCLYVPQKEFQKSEVKTGSVTIKEAQQIGASGQQVAVEGATITAIGTDSVWIQQGTGEYSGVRVKCSSDQSKVSGVSAGDIVTVTGTLSEHSLLNQTWIDVCDAGSITVTGPGAGTPTPTDIVQSISGESWEGVLVRISGSLSISSVTTDDPVFGSFYSIAGTQEGTIAGRPWLYDPTQDPQALPNFASGATMTAVVGIVDSMTDSRQDLMPRSAADFENYTPAP